MSCEIILNAGFCGKRISFGGIPSLLRRFLKQATDWYIGAGLRARKIDAIILKEQQTASGDHISREENFIRRYPLFAPQRGEKGVSSWDLRAGM